MSELERFKRQWISEEWNELMGNADFAAEWNSQLASDSEVQDLTRCSELAPAILYGDARTRSEFRILSGLRSYR
jgi:hypothetical protein